ncbi:kinase-like domain-containing protein [Obelidium mucronatum]|nr:kinase-like domain-containing protein [Obelidium mucronatum]
MQAFLASIPRLIGLNHLLPEKLLSKYQMHFPLGEGATGFVAYATRNEDKVDVAIKCTFKDRLVPGGWKRDSLLGIVPSEVFIMKRLDHENIVRFYELYEDALHQHQHHHHPHNTPSPFSSPQIPSQPDFTTINQPQLHQTSPHLPPTTSTSTSTATTAYSSTPPLIPLASLQPPSAAAATQQQQQQQPTQHHQHHHHPNHRGIRKRAVSKDLFNYIEQKPKMGEGIAKLIFKQIAEAVKYLHGKGFVHRDIKDENVIIDDSMRVKLIDFGASSTIPSSKSDWFTTFDGTIAYAPPECCPLDEMTPIEPYRGPEQDVWSLGMLLYILVETKPPFTKTSTRFERSVKPELGAGRSEGVKDLVAKMMDPDVEKRITMVDVCNHEWLADCVKL